MDTSSIELLTQKEAAELLHIKLETLKQWRKKGMISYRKTGRFVQFAREEIEEFIRGNKTREVRSNGITRSDKSNRDHYR